MHNAQVIKHSFLSDLFVNPLVKAIAGSLFIALCAQICIPIPFHPIPLTGQLFAVLFLGIYQGSKQAAISTALYLFESIIGLPVLAGGIINPLALLGPSAGYLIAMPLAAYIAGSTSKDKSTAHNAFTLALAALTVLLSGTCLLSTFIGWNKSFALGFYPFIPGDMLKILFLLSYMKTTKTLE